MSALPPLPVAVDLYRALLRLRVAEQKVSELYPSDKIQSPVHLSTGQEAVAVGVCRALRPEDHVFGTYRSHGLYVGKGGDLKKMFAELYAKDTGCARGKGGSMHLVAPEAGLMGSSAIVASTIPVAVGDALASEMEGRKRVSVAFFGDGAVDEGVFFESANFALLRNLPVVFVLENNGYAIHSKVADRRKVTDLFRIGAGFGLKGRRFDGTDVFGVFATARAAFEAVRKGAAPLLLEYTTFRWQEHVGPASDLDHAYRAKGEAARARRQDPLAVAKRTLKSRLRVPSADFAKWEAEARAEVEEAVRFAEESPFPAVPRLYEDVFA